MIVNMKLLNYVRHIMLKLEASLEQISVLSGC